MQDEVKAQRLKSFEEPTPLPVGKEEFETYFKEIAEMYDLPQLLSFKHTLAQMIMHLPVDQYLTPRSYFGTCIKKAMANQVAYEIINEIKAQYEQEAAHKAANVEPPETKPVDEPIQVQAVQEPAEPVV